MALRQPLPERPRRYRFALTPLADAMFQLLIFFMLSTSLTPYALLTLKSAELPTDARDSGPGLGDGPAAPTAGRVTFWTVSNGAVRVEDVPYAMDRLGALADALGEQEETGRVVIIIDDSARVQDVASVLEALAGADIDGVQITRGST
ncbi:MAG: ExbD/TolR family protein [Shimia sp.]